MTTVDYEGSIPLLALFSGTRLVGYAECIIEPDKGLCTRAIKYDPEHIKQYGSYVMFDELLSTYVARQGLPVNNGTRSILHDTNVQEFLQKFGFRRQYCRLNIVYSPMLSCVVSLAYPLRALAPRLPEHPLSELQGLAGDGIVPPELSPDGEPAEHHIPRNWGNRSRA